MTFACEEGDSIKITLSRAESLVLFEWLARNSKKTDWENPGLFSDRAEEQLLMDLEADLECVLVEPFDANYLEILDKAYREVLPNPLDGK